MLHTPQTSTAVGLALTAGLLTALAVPGTPAQAADPTPAAGVPVTATTFHGGRQAQELGHSLNAEPCDLDADGLADLTAGAAVALGSPEHADMAAFRAAAGHADSAVDLPQWWSYAADRAVGTWVCVRDTNDDGFDDVVQLPAASGRVVHLQQYGRTRNDAGRLLDHRARSYRFPVGATDLGARAAGSAGDLDGDGTGDVVVSEHRADTAGRTDNGRLWVLAGEAGPTVPTALRSVSVDESSAPGDVLAVIHGAAAGDALGTATPIGDVNGDGRDDLAVASPDAGKVWLVYGAARSARTRVIDLAALAPQDGLLWITQDGGAGLGASLSVAEDVDGDGRQDYLVGTASRIDGSSGGVAVVHGTPAPAPVTVDADAGSVTGADGARGYWIEAARAGDALGFSVAGLGDLDGDGRSDLLLGAPGYDPADPADPAGTLSDAGAAYVLYGRAGTSAQSLAALDPAAGFRLDGSRGTDQAASRPSWFGYRVARAGDVDGNGAEDLAIGAPGRSDHATYRQGGVVVALRGRVETSLALAVAQRVGDGGRQVRDGHDELTPADRLDLRANLRLATGQGHAGEVSFDLDGAPLAGCPAVAATPTEPHRSFAWCEHGVRVAEYGVHTLTARYPGTPGRYAASVSAPTTFYVRDASTTAVRARRDDAGEVVALSAAVAAAGSAAVVDGGTVAFHRAGADQPVTGCEAVAVRAGRATCEAPFGVDADGARAVFSGVSVARAGRPGAGEVAVLAGSVGTLAPAPQGPRARQVRLSLSAAVSRYGEPVQARVQVSPASSGTTEVYVDGRRVGAAALVDGRATVALPRLLRAGRHQVVARTVGTAEHQAAASAAQGLRVRRATSGRVTLRATRVVPGRRPAVRVRVARPSHGARPVGRLVIRAGSTVTKVRLGAARRGTLTVRLASRYRTPLRVRVRFVPADRVNVAAPAAAAITLRPRR